MAASSLAPITWLTTDCVHFSFECTTVQWMAFQCLEQCSAKTAVRRPCTEINHSTCSKFASFYSQAIPLYLCFSVYLLKN